MQIPSSPFSRRSLLAAGGTGLLAPTLLRSGAPAITHGVQSGDVTSSTATIWTRADRPARMFVQVSPTGRFGRDCRTYRGPLLTAASDFTGRYDVRGLPSAADVPYRVVLGAPDAHRPDGTSAEGFLRTAPTRGDHRRIRFLWSGDQAGQGWGRNPDLGGFPIYRAMARRDADFFLHSGDTIYADGPITGDVTLPDGRVYRNVVTEAKSHVAQTLDDFRGAFRYNLEDDAYRAFFARVPQVNQWDDHEVHNNWFPHEILDDAKYTEKRVDVLRARGERAWREYVPISHRRTSDVYGKFSFGPLLDVFVLDMRSYRDENTRGWAGGGIRPDGGILGTEQAQWLVQAMAASRARWKVVQADMPIGLVVPDTQTDPAGIEAIAQGDPGVPRGRERQIAWILRELKNRGVRNHVWLTADVHYTAAHRYDPSRAAFTEFDPFWEFVSGPLHAGSFGPSALDPTFGPTVEFQAVPPHANTSPLEGSQFFGEVEIDPDSQTLTVTLRDLRGAALWSRALHPTT
ncbi:alkaline phosphatase D family protein [Kineococcus rhizosphaerae]|uniref:Alkaline phosphatase D n=1 Tax=Kineococcus rhizosphaerae TaxID=559628 RepID=A0A2T0R810_9ACTN|nr:alkaline phosphatase D family protein [Kineococcus rhizosphaerae]PRY17280.1 alkaline phosphatase D [Kineococcus rhizosphaerae]